MRSNVHAEIEELELDGLTTAADAVALNQMRELNRMDAHEYLAFLLAFTPMHPPGRDIWPDREPFTLD